MKTPRVVVRDDGVLDAQDYKSKLLPHLHRPGREGRSEPQGRAAGAAARLVINGYYLLGKDWLETAKEWQEAGVTDAAGDDHRGQPHRDGGARSSTPSTTSGSTSTNCATRSGRCTSTRRCWTRPRRRRSRRAQSSHRRTTKSDEDDERRDEDDAAERRS